MAKLDANSEPHSFYREVFPAIYGWFLKQQLAAVV
jgi:hypothetical protein